MQVTLSKKDVKYIRDLVKEASDTCKIYGFQGNDELLLKIDRALDKKISSRRKSALD